MENSADQKIYVSISFELNDEGDWKESDDIVLSSGYIIRSIFFFVLPGDLNQKL